MLHFLVTIVMQTPTTVWILLAVLVALGLRQAAPRRIGARRVLVLPAALVLLSLSGVWRTFAAGGVIEPLVAWMIGAAIGAAGTRALELPRGVVGLPDGSLEVPGSFAPMAIMLAIFLVQYILHVALAIDPALAASDAVKVAAGAAFGLPSGMVVA
jgi:hypothetical protein